MNSTYTFHVSGMHCASCVLLIEEALGELPGITHVTASLKNHTTTVTGNFEGRSQEDIASILTEAIKDHGYTVSPERHAHSKKWHEFKVALPLALVFIGVFILMQKLGLVNLIGQGKVTYGTAFVIGVVASLSTCMAVVGGLLLSMSATFAKEGDKIRPQLMFHMGRLASFFILGGVIGAIGSAFTLNTAASFILGIVIALVMLILGVNLLDIFPWTKKFQPSMPKFLSRHALQVSKLNHTLTPLFVGIATFFLPCGFTQSMQLYTLSTGSFVAGGLTMFIFALGTLPILALLSFSSFSIHKGGKGGIFFKTAGLVVIMFALFNFLNSLTIIGALPPLFNF